ncbi:ABC transporter substrate-binding protein [Paenibacillus sp. 1P07SE]|uniref:ABC transporter substrate-binding protein n=1 Tax=Paenibacillus sp. 1P07SE TaxID=3132209 RepID=UPI0039A69547
MRKWGLTVAAATLALGMLAGCGTPGNNQPQGSPPAGESPTAGEADAPKQKVKLQFSIWGNDEHKGMYEGLLAEFKKTHDHIDVEIITIPFADYQQKLSIMAASKTAPDVGWLAERMIPQFIASGQLVDLSASLKEDNDYNFADIYPSTLDLFTKDEALYGIPFSTPPGIIFYNRSLFEANNLKTPLELVAEGNWTYDSFLESARAIADPSQGVYGVRLNREWKNWYDALLPMFWAHGADVFNEDGTAFALNSAEGKQVLEMYNNMIFKDQVHPKPGDEITFETGKVGMYLDRYSYVSKARAITDYEWDIAPMPEGPHGRGTSMGYAGYSVFDTEHPEEAMALLKFLTGAQAMGVTSQFFVPSRQSILESDIFLNADELPGKESIQIAVLDQMEQARVAPSHQNWQQIDVQMQTLLDLLYTQSMSVEDVLARMEQNITPLMK